MDHVLELKNLNVTYVNKERRVMAVRNASFAIDKGDALGLVGESGSGKTTLAMAILRLLSHAEVTGEAIFQGDNLIAMSDEQLNRLRWTGIAVVFQKAMNSLSAVHRIRTQIEDIYRVHYPKATADEIEARMKTLLKLVNMPERVYGLYPHEMSGGMLQRIAIAIALLHNPQLLIFDEATTALDVVTQGQILHEMVELEKTMDMTRIMITHDMSVVAASCNRVAVMYAGELVEIGPVREVIRTPLHPYTKGLMEAYPSLTGKITALKSIPGSLPDLSKPIIGCPFAARCPRQIGKCHTEKPPMTLYENGRQAACWLAGGKA